MMHLTPGEAVIVQMLEANRLALLAIVAYVGAPEGHSPQEQFEIAQRLLTHSQKISDSMREVPYEVS